MPDKTSELDGNAPAETRSAAPPAVAGGRAAAPLPLLAAPRATASLPAPTPGSPLGMLRWLGKYGFQLAFLALTLSIVLLYRETPQYRTLAITFAAIVLEAFPFMLVGALLSGLIEVFVSRDRIAALLPSRPAAAVFFAAGLGLVIPVCECAIVPVVRRLLRKGVPLDAAIAFLLAGPIVNPLVAASTAVAYSFNWTIVATRLGYGYGVAVLVGLLMAQLFRRAQAVLPAVDAPDKDGAHAAHRDEDDCCAGHAHCAADAPPAAGRPALGSRLLLAGRHASEDFLDVARYLVIGAFLAAVLQSFVPREYFVDPAFGGRVMSIALMMALAVLLNLCSESDAFVAASFKAAGMPFSAQMAFMVLGPMLDVKLLLMYTRVFQVRAIVALASLTATTVFLLMLMTELLGGSAAPRRRALPDLPEQLP